jgi:hypothetical protein
MSFIHSLLSGKLSPATEPTTKPTAAVIAVHLENARNNEDTLSAKIAAASSDLDEARTTYGEALRAYALDNKGKQPDYSPVQHAIDTLEGLRRMAADQRATVVRLEAELRTAQHSEAVTNESEALGVLIADSEAALVAFMRAAAEAKDAEVRLFALLFDERTGLKKSFSTSDATARSKQARREISTESIDTAKHLGFKINPDFATDGNANLGDPDRARDFQTFELKREAERANEHYAAESELRKRVAARIASNPEYVDPLYEIGDIVTEVPVER